MLRASIAVAASTAAVLAAGPAAAQFGGQGGAGNRIICESRNNLEAYCPAPNNSGVDLVQQLSQSDCRPARDWTYDRNAIRVRNGCRAVFAARYGGYPGGGYPGGGYPGGGYPGGGAGAQTIRCESWQYRPQRCALNGNPSSVQLQRVTGGDCQQNRSWGWDRSSIWVNNGCRADFLVTYRGFGGGGGYPGGGNPGAGQLVECSSWNYRSASCPAPIRNGAQLERVIGGRCIRGETWDYDRRSIRVWNGCRATFRVF